MATNRGDGADDAIGGLDGRVIAGRFRIAEVVAAGANTIITDAVDGETNQPVTVKVVRPELAATEEFRRAFRRHAEVATALTHPNIATVIDSGEVDFGSTSSVYWVVEYLSGGSLRDLFDRGRLLAPSQALVVGLEACRALDVAHQRGVLHTELTPSKMLFGDDRRLRIVDFGMARLLGALNWADPAHLPTHVARYASPEQALGIEVDAKTDVYALTLSLIEAVTGSVPFAADSTVATLTARVGKLMPVSADLGSLAAVLERAGRPETEDRSTAAELGQGLVQAASKLPRPDPIPILAGGLFATSEMRRPTDPTGGIARPDSDGEPLTPAQPAVAAVDADEVLGDGSPDQPDVDAVGPEAAVEPGSDVDEVLGDGSPDQPDVDAVGPEAAVEPGSDVDEVLGDGSPDQPDVDAVGPEAAVEPGSDVDEVLGDGSPDQPDVDAVGPEAAVEPGSDVDEVLGDGSPDQPDVDAVGPEAAVEPGSDVDEVLGDGSPDQPDVDAVGPEAAVEPAADVDGVDPSAVIEPAADDDEPGAAVGDRPAVGVDADEAPKGGPADGPPLAVGGAAAADATPGDAAPSATGDAGEADAPGDPGAETEGDGPGPGEDSEGDGPGPGGNTMAVGVATGAGSGAPSAAGRTEHDAAAGRAGTRAATVAAGATAVAASTAPGSTTDAPLPAVESDASSATSAGAAGPGVATVDPGSAETTAEPDEPSGTDGEAGGEPQPLLLLTDVADPPTRAVEVGADGSGSTDAATTTTPPPHEVAPPPPPSDEPVVYDEERPRRRVGKIIALTLVVLVGIAGLAYAGWWLLRTKSYDVPDLAGVNVDVALDEISGNDWLVTIERERDDAEPTIDNVIRTDPGPGVSLDEGDGFLMVVSDGPELRTLAEINGVTVVQAETRLAEQRLIAVVETKEFSETVPLDSVISWRVQDDDAATAGSQVLPDTTILLTVSDGPAPRPAPALTGLTLPAATTETESLQLELVRGDDVFSDDAPVGEIVFQDPAPGTLVPRGGSVAVQLSKGPDVVPLPDLTGLVYTDAERLLLDTGFTIGNLLGTTEGTFVSLTINGESVEVGTSFRRGTAVDLIFL